jgi:hypothetical protein
VASPDEPTAEEHAAILRLVAQLRADGDTTPLVALLKAGREGPERARDALTILAELDPELIVQVVLDALIQAHVDDHVAAPQTRRVTRVDR